MILTRFKRFELNDNDYKKHTFVRDGVTYHRSYKCPKKRWTIGWGSMIEDDRAYSNTPLQVREKMMSELVITEAEAERRLIKEIEIAEKDIRKMISNFDELNEARQEALIHMSFTMGKPGLKSFAGGTTFNYLRAGAFNSAGESLKRTKWFKDVGEIRANEVVDAIKYGVWSEDVVEQVDVIHPLTGEPR